MTNQLDVLICLDEAHDPGNEIGPNYDGDRAAPIWALKVVTDGLAENWGLRTLGEGLTYAGAMQLARKLGYDSAPIGPVTGEGSSD